jgi:hypothetical protein
MTARTVASLKTVCALAGYVHDAGYACFQTQHRRDALSTHADKILALGAAHLREPVESKVLTAE